MIPIIYLPYYGYSISIIIFTKHFCLCRWLATQVQPRALRLIGYIRNRHLRRYAFRVTSPINEFCLHVSKSVSNADICPFLQRVTIANDFCPGVIQPQRLGLC